ncbi:hypothetical protein LCGC14_1289100 [marine sediment metagenome]|uniref:Uncharacterized protein n=1 Tax=marine sediment metagenome TaxID=412755 RepID=A0A0F9NVY3_9ZZZZ
MTVKPSWVRGIDRSDNELDAEAWNRVHDRLMLVPDTRLQAIVNAWNKYLQEVKRDEYLYWHETPEEIAAKGKIFRLLDALARSEQS